MAQNLTIRFVRHWRGRSPGDVDSALDYGVAEELIRRGVAEAVQKTTTVSALPPGVRRNAKNSDLIVR